MRNIVEVPAQLADKFWRGVKIDGPQNCWEWQRGKENGYGAIWMSHVRRSTTTHRISYLIHYGAIPNGFVIGHKCDNRGCCNPFHLELITQAQNARDGWSRNRMECKISKDTADEIRSSSAPTLVVAKAFGLSKTHVNRIRRGEAWTR